MSNCDLTIRYLFRRTREPFVTNDQFLGRPIQITQDLSLVSNDIREFEDVCNALQPGEHVVLLSIEGAT